MNNISKIMPEEKEAKRKAHVSIPNLLLYNTLNIAAILIAVMIEVDVILLSLYCLDIINLTFSNYCFIVGAVNAAVFLTFVIVLTSIEIYNFYTNGEQYINELMNKCNTHLKGGKSHEQ